MSTNKNDYINQIVLLFDIPIFFQPWWLDILAGKDGWDVVISRESGQITGVWPFIKIKKFGQYISTAPPLTPFLGPYLFYPDSEIKSTTKYSFEKKNLAKLGQAIKDQRLIFFNQKMSPSYKNGLPLHWLGFRQHTLYRSLLTNINNTEKVYKQFKSNRKQRIKKFLKYGTIETSTESSHLYYLIKKSFARREKTPAFSSEQYQLLTNKIQKESNSVILYAFGPEKDLRAGILLVYDQDTAYLISTGFDGSDNNAVGALIWQGIQLASEKVSKFDFCGSIIPGISDFFQSFGATLEPYSQIQYFSNRKIESLYTFLRKD